MTFWELYLGIGVVVGPLLIALSRTIRNIYSASLPPSPDEQAPDLVSPAMRALRLALETVFLAAIWPLAVLVRALTIQKEISDMRIRNESNKKFKVRRQDLIEVLSIEEIERREKVFDPLDAVPAAPFGFLNPEWISFRAKMQSEDVVWSFSSRWKRFATQKTIQGYALARGQDVGDFFITSVKLESPELKA